MAILDPNLSKSALLTIDVQCDFSLPGSPFEITGTISVIPNMEKLVQTFRSKNLPIIHIVRLYLKDGSNADLCRRERIAAGQWCAEPGTQGAEVIEALKPNPGFKLNTDLLLSGAVQKWSEKEFVIYKPRWGAFFGTQLDNLLQQTGVDTLVICGCNFPNCPRASIYEASERDFRLVAISDAISGIYEKGISELKNIGVRFWDTETCVQRLNEMF